MVDILPVEYKYYTTDLLTNSVLAEIPFRDASFERALRRAGTFSGTIPVIPATDHLDLYENTMPGKTGLYITRNNVCVWGGMIWSRSYSASSKTLNINASEFTSYFYHRNIWQTLVYGSEYLFANSYQVSSGTGTVTTEAEHGFSIGDTVRIKNVNPAIDGDHEITGLTNSTQSFNVSFKSIDSTTPGTVTATLITSVPNIVAVGDTVTVSSVGSPFDGSHVVTRRGPNDTFSYDISGGSFLVTQRSMTGGVATLTTSSAHGYSNGSTVRVSRINGNFNGEHVIVSTPTSTTFTYAVETDITVLPVETTGFVTLYFGEGTAASGSISVTAIDRTFQFSTTSGNLALSPTTIGTARSIIDSYSIARDLINYLAVDFQGLNFTNDEIEPYKNYQISVVGKQRSSNVATITTLSAASITNKQLTNNFATITTSTSHGFRAEDIVTVSDLGSPFDGDYEIFSIPSSTTFTYIKNAPNVASTNDAGTATVGHGLVIGQEVELIGVDAGMNGYQTVTATPTRSTFQFLNTGSTLSFTAVTGRTVVLINSKQITSSVATITTSSSHGLSAGTSIVIEGVDSTYDGRFEVLSTPTSTTFTYALPSILDYPEEAVYGGAVIYGGRVSSGSYGPYASNGDIDIDYSTNSSSEKYIGDTQQIFRGYENRTVGEVLEQFSDNLEGFEYRIDCDYDFNTASFTRTFTFIDLPGALAPGESPDILNYDGATDIVFEFPGNVFEFSIDESAEDSATRMWVIGNDSSLGDNASQPYSAATNKEYLTNGWPLLDQTEDAGEEVSEDNLHKLGIQFLAESVPPIGDFKMSINGSIDPVVGSYYPGQWCSIILDDDFARLRIASNEEPAWVSSATGSPVSRDIIVRKIEKIKVSVPDDPSFPETVTLDLIDGLSRS